MISDIDKLIIVAEGMMQDVGRDIVSNCNAARRTGDIERGCGSSWVGERDQEGSCRHRENPESVVLIVRKSEPKEKDEPSIMISIQSLVPGKYWLTTMVCLNS